MLCLSGGLAALARFLIPASFAGPQRKRPGWIRARLIHRAIGRNDLPAASRTNTPPRGALLNIECQRIVATHPGLIVAFVLPQNNEDRTEDRDWRRQQDEHADIEVAHKPRVGGAG